MKNLWKILTSLFTTGVLLFLLTQSSLGASVITSVFGGGTGTSTIANGGLPYGSSTNISLNVLPIGSTGYVLQSTGLKPTWVATSTLGLTSSGITNAYASSTFVSFSYASSTFPSFTYGSSTYQTTLPSGTVNQLLGNSSTNAPAWENATSTGILFVDGASGNSTQNGSAIFPYHTLSGALASSTPGSNFAYYLAPNTTYIDGAPDTFSANTFINGNQSTYVPASGVTFSNSFDIYDLTIAGNVNETDKSLTSIHALDNGVLSGSLTEAGNALLLDEALPATTSLFTVASSSLTNAAASFIQTPVLNYGTMNINDSQVSGSTTNATVAGNYMVTSTTSGQTILDGVTLINYGANGGDVNSANGATSSPNIFDNVSFIVNSSTAGSTLNCGSAACIVANDSFTNLQGQTVLPTGTNWQPFYAEDYGVLNAFSVGTTTMQSGGGLLVTATSTLATTTINGTLTVNSIANCNSTQYLQITSGLFGCGTPSGGGSNYWTTTTNGIYNNSGYLVGVNSTTPTGDLSVEGTTTATGIPIFAVASSSGLSYLQVGGAHSDLLIPYGNNRRDVLAGVGTGPATEYNPTTSAYIYIFPTVSIGYDAGAALIASTTAATAGVGTYGDTAVGSFALETATSTVESTAVGSFALNNATNSFNTGFGMDAGRGVTSGSSNTAIGNDTLISSNIGASITGVNNSTLGWEAAAGITQGSSYNTILGAQTAFVTSVINDNVMLGDAVDYNIASGNNNVLEGFNAANNIATSSQNVIIGAQAGVGGSVASTTNQDNVIIGYNSGNANVVGNNNVYLGYETGQTATSSSNSVFLGNAAGYNDIASNVFYLNNVQESSVANDNTYSLLYGKFSGSAASLSGQQLTINGALNVTQGTSTLATTTVTGVVGINATSSTAALDVQGEGNLNPLLVASSSGATDLIVLANGNVGIGTSTPVNTLSVIGNISDSNLTVGDCVQAATGGQLNNASSGCITGTLSSPQIPYGFSAGVVAGTNNFEWLQSASTLQVTGSTTISNILNVTGTSTLATTTVSTAVLIGTTTLSSPFSNTVSNTTLLGASASTTGYAEINLVNHSASTTASGDYVATANNGTSTSYYADFGINSSGFTNTGGLSGGPDDAYLFNSDNSLYLGTASTTNANANIYLVAQNTQIATGTKSGLTFLNASSTGQLSVLGNSILATTTVSQLTLGDGITSTFLAANSSGQIIATTTPSGGGGTNYWTTTTNGIYNNSGYLVGVNSTTPSADLAVEGSTTNASLPIFNVASSSGQSYLEETSGGGLVLYDNQNVVSFPFGLTNAGGGEFYIDNSGNVYFSNSNSTMTNQGITFTANTLPVRLYNNGGSAGTYLDLFQNCQLTSCGLNLGNGNGAGNGDAFLQSNGINKVAMGTQAPSPGTSTATTPDLLIEDTTSTSTAPLFAVASSTNTVTFQINSNGNVGINTTTPAYGFVNVGTAQLKGLTTSAGAETDALCLDSNAQVINDSDTTICGNLSAARYKQNIEPLAVNALAELMQLQPVSFNYKKDYLGGLANANNDGTEYGLIADQVQQVDKNLVIVSTASSTFEGKSYPAGTVEGLQQQNYWIGFFTKAIQQQQQEIQNLTFSKFKDAQDKWQDILIGILIIYAFYNEYDKRRRK